MTDLQGMIDELYSDVEWQRLPVVMNETGRRKYISRCLEQGIEMLYITIGRAAEYSRDMYVRDVAGTLLSMEYDLPVDEKRYAMLSAKIEFFRKVQTDVNNIVGYTTDALTVTNADKPYVNLAATITDLERERRFVHYKMSRYSQL